MSNPVAATDRSDKVGTARHRVVALAAFVGVALSLTAFIGVSDWDRRLRDLKIEDLARNRNQTIAGDLAYTDELLQTLAEHIESLDHPVTRADYLAFAGRVRARHPELRSTGWAVTVKHAERAAFERMMREQGYPDFEIWENDPKGNRIRAADRKDTFRSSIAILATLPPS